RVRQQVDELERVGRLKRYLSPQLAELIVSSGDESVLESHRREITVVFCDLRGYTAFAETAEPEELMGMLREYHAALGGLSFEYAAIGTVTNLAARLCGEAGSGRILVSRRVYAAVEERVEAEAVGELALKGLVRPVPTYNVVALKELGSSVGA